MKNATKISPCIIVDSREQTPLYFSNYPSEGGTLATGDYSVKGFENEFTIERKSLADLIASVTHDRERFERELVRMRGYEFRRLVVVGAVADIETHNYRSQAKPAAILASLTAFEIRYGLPVAWVSTATAAAVQIERWAYYFLRERIKSASDILKQYKKHIQSEPRTEGAKAQSPILTI